MVRLPGDTDVSLTDTPDGRRLFVSRVVDAPADAVWDVLRDTERWPDWGPSVRSVESPTRYVERGTTGRVRTAAGVWVPFEITACENRRWTWDVAGLTATGHVVRETDAGTVVGFEIPLAASGYAPVCALACRDVATLVEPK
ncbi:SRPBCC family protein [Haloarcula litorea]|uniref:SRPBCC family protein n=1 Tax=Haloarcula litorea TaxID=3032579 RepID=UPI0023E7C493|nr:SRPBCC family protein [Halomicroarcula sp. GDY20]